MKYWYVEVPITEGKFCKRFNSREEAEKEAERIRNGEKTELRGYGTEVFISTRSTQAVARSEKIVNCEGAEIGKPNQGGNEMTDNKIDVADKLRELRAEAFLGLRMASEKTGISAMRISQIECGEGDPLSKPEKDRLEKVYLDAIDAKKEPYIVRVPVRGILSMTFDSWEKARKEVDRIQSDYQTLEQLSEAGYKLDSMAFTYESTCRPVGMMYGEEETK